MAYWWVNHKQTAREELEGGYVWSPRVNRNGARNETYLNLTRTRPGDIVFSYAGGRIAAVGVVTERCRSCERPSEFGELGAQWGRDGWKVNVLWTRLEKPIVPKRHLDDLVPLLPETHAPIRANGDGNQAFYLTSIGEELGGLLLKLARYGSTGRGREKRQ